MVTISLLSYQQQQHTLPHHSTYPATRQISTIKSKHQYFTIIFNSNNRNHDGVDQEEVQ